MSNVNSSNITQITKESFLNIIDEIKKIFNAIKKLLNDIRNVKGIKEFISLIETFLREFPLSKPIMDKFFRENLDEKINRMQDVNNSSVVIQNVYSIIEFISKCLYTIFESSQIVIGHLPFFEKIIVGENDFITTIERSINIVIYKEIYRMMINEGISPQYTSAWIMLMAMLSPIYYIVFSFKGKPNKTDSDFYINPLINIPRDSNTGFTDFEKRILKITKELIEEYNSIEDDTIQKEFILSKNIFIQSLKMILSLFALLMPITINLWGIKSLYLVYQFLITILTSLILFTHLIYSTIALKSVRQKYKELDS